MSRTRTITGAGAIATAALVLLFGNQAVTEWVARHANTDSLWDWFLHRLTWPSWILAPRDGSSASFRSLLAQDLRALFLVLFVAVILAVVSKSVSGGGGGLLPGLGGPRLRLRVGGLDHRVHHLERHHDRRARRSGRRLGVRSLRGLDCRNRNRHG